MSQKHDNRKEILVVDDELDTLEVLCTLLRVNGFTAVGVDNADAALEQVRKHVPDLFLIDYMMPDTDGITTLQRCRALPDAGRVPAVMLTADSRLDTLERAISRGFDAFLTKPILDNDEFVGRLKDVMSRFF